MGFGLQPLIGKATYRLNCWVARLLPQKSHLIVLTYHRIGSPAQLWPEPIQLAESSLEQFEAEMEWISRYCSPLDLDTVWSIVHEGKAFPNRPVLVTFDDGYREDIFRIVPCLKHFQIRPVVFLATDYINTNRRFWWDRIGTCIQTTVKRHVVCTWAKPIVFSLETSDQRETAINHVIAYAKTLMANQRDRFLADLETELEVADTREAKSPLVLSWDEVRELSSILDFGAHTASHPVLSSLSAEQVYQEMIQSKTMIENQLGKQCFSFAIPYGTPSDFSTETIKVADEVGFRLIFSLLESLSPPKKQGSITLIDRICLSTQGGLPGLALKVTWPTLFVPNWTKQTTEYLTKLRDTLMER